jgi:hypothetical protein
MVDAAIFGEGERGKMQRKIAPDRCGLRSFPGPVLSTTRYSGTVADCFMRTGFFAEFFAKLCAIGTPNHPMWTSVLR